MVLALHRLLVIQRCACLCGSVCVSILLELVCQLLSPSLTCHSLLEAERRCPLPSLPQVYTSGPSFLFKAILECSSRPSCVTHLPVVLVFSSGGPWLRLEGVNVALGPRGLSRLHELVGIHSKETVQPIAIPAQLWTNDLDTKGVV